MATSTSTSNDRLPSTLFTVYQTYKRGTSVVLEWLTTFDKSPTRKPAATKKTPAPVSAPNAVTVKQLLEKARRASKNQHIPPPAVHDAFRIVLVNRHTLTKYYDNLPAASVETKAATLRHKVFNDTLAQAYTILFPSSVTAKRVSKKSVSDTPQHMSTPTANTFEALSRVVEEEPEFEACASDFWQAESTSRPVDSAISDDSVGDAVALHAYVTELQNTVETVNGLWKSAFAGEIPLAAAGWLANVVQNYMVEWIRSQSPVGDHHEALIVAFFQANDRRKEERFSFVPMWLEDPEGFRSSSEQDIFQDLTHGYGLLWPYQQICEFAALGKGKDETLAVVERRRFEDYFKAHPHPDELKKGFVDAILDYLPIREAYTIDEHYKKIEDISDKRYEHDESIVRSMCRSIYQHAMWNCPLDDMMDCRSTWMDDSFRDNGLQSPLGVPLLWSLRQTQEDKVATRTSLVVGAHIFVESCRSFVPKGPSGVPRRTNNKINVLSYAKSSRNAIKRLLDTSKDPAKANSLYTLWRHNATLQVQQLDDFASDKTFDLYSQSPWVTGSHMATIAARNMYVGLGALNNHGLVSNLLHFYNMLRQLQCSCPKIDILERLCDVFAPALFQHSEGRPKSNFDNAARVTNGQILAYRKNGKMQLAGKARAKERARKVGEMPRFFISSLSDFAWEGLMNQCCLSQRVLAKITDKRLSDKKHDVMPSILARFTPSQIFVGAKELIMPEFEGSFPLAKINFFAVMELVLKVFSEIAHHISKPDQPLHEIEQWIEFVKENPTLGSVSDVYGDTVEAANNFLEKIRFRVDHHEMYRGLKGSISVVYDESLLVIRDAIVKICGDVKPEDYLWKDM